MRSSFNLYERHLIGIVTTSVVTISAYRFSRGRNCASSPMSTFLLPSIFRAVQTSRRVYPIERKTAIIQHASNHRPNSRYSRPMRGQRRHPCEISARSAVTFQHLFSGARIRDQDLCVTVTHGHTHGIDFLITGGHKNRVLCTTHSIQRSTEEFQPVPRGQASEKSPVHA